MRNRDLINRKLDTLDGIFRNLLFLINTNQPPKSCKEAIEKGITLVEETNSLINLESVGFREIRK